MAGVVDVGAAGVGIVLLTGGLLLIGGVASSGCRISSKAGDPSLLISTLDPRAESWATIWGLDWDDDVSWSTTRSGSSRTMLSIERPTQINTHSHFYADQKETKRREPHILPHVSQSVFVLQVEQFSWNVGGMFWPLVWLDICLNIAKECQEEEVEVEVAVEEHPWHSIWWVPCHVYLKKLMHFLHWTSLKLVLEEEKPFLSQC